MIISRISGGLGNQLFQYALGKNLAIKNNTDLYLDLSFFENNKNDAARSFFLDNFNTSYKVIDKKKLKKISLPEMDNKKTNKIKRKIFRVVESFKPIYKKKFIIEPYFNFCSDILKIKNNCFLSGVWQSEKYFLENEDVIRKDFTLKKDLSETTKDYLTAIENSNSISIHIRRGDYVNNQKTNTLHGTCSLNYYKKAIKTIEEKTSNPNYFIFSDDIDWVRNNLNIKKVKTFVSGKGITDYEEMILMSKCKHNIIANSSFSWWGAWLNTNFDKIVIAPKNWFNDKSINTKDLLPNSWLTIYV